MYLDDESYLYICTHSTRTQEVLETLLDALNIYMERFWIITN